MNPSDQEPAPPSLRGAPAAGMTATEEQLDRVIDHLLTFMTIPSWDVSRDTLFPHYPLTPAFFSGAEPFIHDRAAELVFHHSLGEEEYGIFIDATPDALDGRVDVVTLGADGEDGDWRDGRFALTRLRGIPPETARGRVHTWAKHFVEVSRVWVQGEAPAEGHRHLFGSNGDCRWRAVQAGYKREPTKDDVWTRIIQLHLGLQFTRRYYWSVELGYQGLPQIRFPTTGAGAREVFRLRDLPEGRDRRQALRHWVKGHWRQRPGGGDPALVRDYLRGQTDFVWHGLRCQLRPSRFDLERDETYRTLAKADRQRARAGLRPKEAA